MSPRLLPFPLLLVACSGGGGGAPPAADTPAVVQSIAFPAQPAGAIPLQITLVDPESDPADLSLEVSLDDGATWRPARLAPGQTLTGVATSPAGSPTTVLWDSLQDLGFRPQSQALLRVTPSRSGLPGVAAIQSVPAVANLPLAAAAVQSHMVHYGPMDPATLALAKTHDLVIVHPFAGQLQAATVHELMRGVDPADPADDVIVLSYISIGEDLRTIGISDQDMLLDPRFVGSAQGPRIDPRGPGAGGQPLSGIDPLGLPTNAPVGTRYASFYLDDNSVDNDPGNIGDGLPDRNSFFGGCFVNAGDPAWLDVLDAMQIDGVDGVPGIQELLTPAYGRGYSCDGLFFDTIDTCAPNSFTNGSSPNQSEFEWTAPGFRTFMQNVRQRYPDKLLLQNRGLFFFDPRHPHFAVTTRAQIDFLLLESYRLDSSVAQQFDAYFFPDNKHNIAPKLMAEANRQDGFTVLSLGYAEGPGIDRNTLLGTSTVGEATLLEDILETEQRAGFRHYLTDAGIQLANTFVRDHALAAGSDALPPTWTSTYNDNAQPFPTPPGAPTPRIGIQRAQAGPDCITVSWDVALDQNRVAYALYHSVTPFDFTADPSLASANRTVLTPQIGDGYTAGVGPSVYPYQFTLTGLSAGTTYHLCLRAFDALANEDQNQIVLTATPQPPPQITIDGSFTDWQSVPIAHTDPADVPASAGPDWLEIKVFHDQDNLYVRYTSDDPFNLDGSPTYGFSRTLIFLDLDESPATGWPIAGIGSDLLIAGAEMFGQSSSVYNTGSLGNLSVLPVTNVTECELAIPWAVIDGIHAGASQLRLSFVNDDVNDYAPDAGSVSYTASR